MRFVSINDKAPLRLLRQRGSITDEELVEFLATERSFKLRQALRGERWVDVYDIRRFEGLTAPQTKLAFEYLSKNLACMTEGTLAVAFVVQPKLEERARGWAKMLEGGALPTCVTGDLEEALYWALELAYDAEGTLDAELVLGGIDAFRFVVE